MYLIMKIFPFPLYAPDEKNISFKYLWLICKNLYLYMKVLSQIKCCLPTVNIIKKIGTKSIIELLFIHRMWFLSKTR